MTEKNGKVFLVGAGGTFIKRVRVEISWTQYKVLDIYLIRKINSIVHFQMAF